MGPTQNQRVVPSPKWVSPSPRNQILATYALGCVPISHKASLSCSFDLDVVHNSLVCRHGYPDAICLGIETAMQNFQIAIFILRFALPEPENDLAGVVILNFTLFGSFTQWYGLEHWKLYLPKNSAKEMLLAWFEPTTSSSTSPSLAHLRSGMVWSIGNYIYQKKAQKKCC